MLCLNFEATWWVKETLHETTEQDKTSLDRLYEDLKLSLQVT